jgi:muramidase (phage lysozyme)
MDKKICNILRKLDKFKLFSSSTVHQYDPIIRKPEQTDLKSEEATGAWGKKPYQVLFGRNLITKVKL